MARGLKINSLFSWMILIIRYSTETIQDLPFIKGQKSGLSPP